MTTFILILKLFPLLLSTIQELETLAPVPKTGSSKLQLVTDTILAAFKADPSVHSTISESSLTSLVGVLTSNVVAFCNQIGVFKKSA